MELTQRAVPEAVPGRDEHLAPLGEVHLASVDLHFRADLLPWVAKLLHGCTPGVVREASIVVGELLANAYVHGEPPFRVWIAARRRGYVLRLGVDDGGGAPAKPWLPAEGLFVVRGLCPAWGVDAHDGGKSVWADLRVLVPPLTTREEGPPR
jgi:hypothetical protein